MGICRHTPETNNNICVLEDESGHRVKGTRTTLQPNPLQYSRHYAQALTQHIQINCSLICRVVVVWFSFDFSSFVHTLVWKQILFRDLDVRVYSWR